VGISVDHRRTNLSEKTLQENVQRLKAYKAKLVVFPRKPAKPKKGEATKEERKAVHQQKGVIQPIKTPALKTSYRKIHEYEQQDKGAFFALRVARTDARLVGHRKKAAAKKAAAAADEAAKKQ